MVMSLQNGTGMGFLAMYGTGKGTCGMRRGPSTERPASITVIRSKSQPCRLG